MADANVLTVTLNKDMVKFNRWMVWCTIGITAMTVAILLLTAYIALWK